ncbi:MAG: hypothetical protein GY869_02675 [Planctomycetes bacterium]|nr:hypothetical protein [Planctomycetota bacterium]
MNLVQKLPDNVVFLYAGSGGDALQSDFDKSVLGSIWQDPGVQNIVESLKTQLVPMFEAQTSAMDPTQSEAINVLSELVPEVLKHPVIAGIGQLPLPAGQAQSSQDLPFYLFFVLEAKSQKTSIIQIVNQLEKSAAANNIQDMTVGSHRFRGVIEKNPDMTVYWGWVNDYFVLTANDTDHAIVNGLTQTPGQSASVLTQKINRVSGTDDAAILYVDFAEIGAMMSESIPEDDQSAGEMKLTLAQLGLDKVKSYTLRTGFSGADLVQNSMLEMPGPMSGLFEAMQPIDINVLNMVDSDAITLGLYNIDLAKLFDTVMTTLQSNLDAKTYEQIHMTIAGVEQQLGINIRDDLLESMAGQMIIYSTPSDAPAPDPQEANPMMPMPAVAAPNIS